MKKTPISKIKTHPLNEKIYSPSDLSELKESILECGVLEPITINKKNMRIVSGHRRVKASMELGLKSIPANFVVLTPKQEKKNLIHHNRQRVKTASDILNEVQVLMGLVGDGRKKRCANEHLSGKVKTNRQFIAQSTGQNESTIFKLLFIDKHEKGKRGMIQMIDDGKISISNAYEIARKRERIISSQNSQKRLKRKFRNRDIVEGEDFTIFQKSSTSMDEVGDGDIQTIITSPPFWNRRDYNIKGQIGLERSFEKYLNALGDVFDECWRVLSDDGCMFVEMADNFNKGSLMNNPHRFLQYIVERNGWCHRNTIIWNKTNTIPQSRRRFSPAYSFIFFLSKNDQHKWNMEQAKIESNYRGGKYFRHHFGRMHTKPDEVVLSPFVATGFKHKTDVFTESTAGGLRKDRVEKEDGVIHPAMFPPHLFETPISTTTDAGDTILDPFSGYASTGVAALNQGRKYIGYELNPAYIESSRKRLVSLRERQKAS